MEIFEAEIHIFDDAVTKDLNLTRSNMFSSEEIYKMKQKKQGWEAMIPAIQGLYKNIEKDKIRLNRHDKKFAAQEETNSNLMVCQKMLSEKFGILKDNVIDHILQQGRRIKNVETDVDCQPLRQKR